MPVRGVQIKPGRLNVSRKNLFHLVMRDQQPGRTHGQWVPLTSHGYTVICASVHDANEIRTHLALSLFPRTRGQTEAEWEGSLEQWMKIVPHEYQGHHEMWDRDLLRGWIPTAEEMLRGSRDSADLWETFQRNQRSALGVRTAFD